MPTLPLPGWETDLNGGDLPVVDKEDVLEEFPRPIRNAETAPVRDAFAEAWTEGFLEYQRIASYAAAQSDPMRATGEYLRSYADERSIVPTKDESDESIRARLFAAPEIVSPQAIVDGVNEILATVTDKTCRFLELGLDGWFVRADPSTAPWNSFVGASPDYPDRYYDEDDSFAAKAAYPSRGLPRNFVLQVPKFNTTEDDYPYVSAVAGTSGPFALSTNWPGTMFVFEDPQTVETMCSRVVATVERIKGQGISWSFIEQ